MREFHRWLRGAVERLACEIEIPYVNHGSTDRTPDVVRRLRGSDDRVALVDLSRNFGKEIAMTARFDHSRSDAVADLEDPPDLTPELPKPARSTDCF